MASIFFYEAVVAKVQFDLRNRIMDVKRHHDQYFVIFIFLNFDHVASHINRIKNG